MIYANGLKRLIDVLVSLSLLILLGPLLLVIAILLAVQNRGSPFFTQKRPGLRERAFRILKFKTMHDGRDAQGKLLPDNQRLTRTGRLVRRLSLDELPQLWNVLRGDMSLVGPRPLLMRYLKLYSNEQRRRHQVKPGITGYAQVNGRNALNWSEKFDYDLYYVDNLSWSLDMKILWQTFMTVFSQRGVNQSKDNTMPPFNGRN